MHVSAISRKLCSVQKRIAFPLLPLVEPSFHKDKKFRCCLTIFRHPQDCTGTHKIQSIHLDPTPDQTYVNLNQKARSFQAVERYYKGPPWTRAHPFPTLVPFSASGTFGTSGAFGGSGASTCTQQITAMHLVLPAKSEREKKRKVYESKGCTNQHKSSSMKK